MATPAKLVRTVPGGRAEELTPPAGAGPTDRLSALEGLRQLTRPAHQQLDRDLELLHRPLSPERFRHVLGRLLGFFRSWEPAVASSSAAAFLGERSRIPLLEADLLALGTSPAQIAALPNCLEASRLGCSPGVALGSLYVLEGSRQGGRVIRRVVRGESWVPAVGLQYFEDGGPAADLAWQRLTEGLAATAWDRADPEIGRGALDTFDVLRSWMTETGTR